MSVYESHKQHLRKLLSLADLSTDDLKQFSGVEEKLTSHQRQKLAKTRFTKIVQYREEQLQYFAYILENCLFMLWRHLEYYLIHCVPVNQQTSTYPSQNRRHTQLRRLQDLTGISHSSFGESDADSLPDIDRQLLMGVTSDDIETLKQTANSAIHDSILKKIQKIDQGEVFHGILRDRQPSLSLPALLELALTTAVLTRANSRGIPDAELDDLDPAGIELKGQKVRIERQMLALMPKYCISERVNKQLKLLESDESTRGKDLSSELTLVFLEVSSNVTSYCRAVISTSRPTSQFSRVLFRLSLDEALARDLGSTDDTSFLSSSTVQVPSLGVVVYQLRQCANHFMSVYESHKQHLRKLQSLADLSTDDLKQFSGVEEKLTSHQRQKLSKTRLTKIVHYKEEQLQYFAYILENCLLMLWRHLEYYLIHFVPVNQQTSTYQSQTRRQSHTQLRRLQAHLSRRMLYGNIVK